MELQKYDVIIQEGKRVSVITETVGEVIGDVNSGSNTGWKRSSGDIPSDYKALFTDTYWNIYPPYTLEEARNGVPYKQSSSTETKSTNMFKKGDYIVALALAINNEKYYSTAKVGWCIKQNIDGNYLSVDKDCSVSRCSNACDVFTFDKRNDLRDWRYATPEERAEYDKLGHPFDTTVFKKKEENLVGRYIKALVDSPNAGSVKRNEIGIIIEDGTNLKADFPSQKRYRISRHYITDGSRYELMPVGWIPPSHQGVSGTTGVEYAECLKAPTHWCKQGAIYRVRKRSNGVYQWNHREFDPSTPTEWDGYGNNEEFFKYFRLVSKLAYDSQPIRNYSSDKKETPSRTLLEEAERRYPKGTKFASLISGRKRESTGKFHENGNDIEGDGNYVYYNGKWANIISTPEKSLELRIEDNGSSRTIKWDDDYTPTFAKKKIIKFTPRVELQKEVEYTPSSKKRVKKIVTSF